MSELTVFLLLAFSMLILGAIIYFVVYVELRDLESQVSYDRRSAEENYLAHWKRIEDLRDQHRALEKYLGIEYVKRSGGCYTKAKGEQE